MMSMTMRSTICTAEMMPSHVMWRKEVINLCDGCRLGCVGDLDVQVPEGTVKGIIVFGPCRFFGLFGRGEDFYVPWDCIQKFGDDIILIDKPFQKRQPPPPPRRKKGWFG